MKRNLVIFLQIVVVLVGISTLVLLLAEPHFEGRNVDATLFEIYFNDPFLAYVYLGSIPFFVILYQAFRLIGRIRKNEIFSLHSLEALRTIKYCAISLIGFIIGAETYIFVAMYGKDDITGGVAMGLFLMFISAIIATAAAVFEKLLQNAVDIKSENELTV
ncbi:MAG TPA: DUF2975 domain-containing protein [Candidatus Magasanikbacteria bacterium]|nr:DUF2975 domain-containing protein [Candidatus Magasanikbacteria bacterium]